MQAISVRGLGAGVLAATTVGVAVLAFTGSASAEQAQAAKPAKLKIAIKGDKLDFFGADSVEKGQKLEIVNKTSVGEIGPHTFTLVKPKLINSGEKRKRCEQFRGKLCPNILEAPRSVRRRTSRSEGPIWTGASGLGHGVHQGAKGDSSFTDERGATETRKVKAEVGKTLGYFCVVHPFMRGRLEVE